MTADDEVVALRAANAALQAENAQVRADLAAARDLIAQLQARITELEQRKTPPPAFVKANPEQKEAPGPRKKRDPRHNAGRRREKPTQIVPQTTWDKLGTGRFSPANQLKGGPRGIVVWPK